MEFNGGIIFIQFSLCRRRRFQRSTSSSPLRQRKRKKKLKEKKRWNLMNLYFENAKIFNAICIEIYCRINRTLRVRTPHTHKYYISVIDGHRQTGIRQSKLLFSLLCTHFAPNRTDSRRSRWRRGGWRRNENESKIIMRQKQQQLQEHGASHKVAEEKVAHAACQTWMKQKMHVHFAWHGHRYLTIWKWSLALVHSCALLRSIATTRLSIYALPVCRTHSLSLPHIHTYEHTPLPNVSTLLGADYCCK